MALLSLDWFNGGKLIGMCNAKGCAVVLGYVIDRPCSHYGSQCNRDERIGYHSPRPLLSEPGLWVARPHYKESRAPSTSSIH